MTPRISPEQINQLCGIPWVYRESDCWAIFKACSALIGVDVGDIELPEQASTKSNPKVFQQALFSPNWQRTDRPELGCAIIFYGQSNRAFHIGFALDNKWMLHSLGSSQGGGRSCCEKINAPINKGRFSRYEIYRYMG